MTVVWQMGEDKVAFDRDSENHRRDLARMQNKRVQEFDLLTTTAGLDLIHIVHATEPNSPVEEAVGPADLGRRPVSDVFSAEGPAKFSSELRASSSHRLSADVSALVKTKDQQRSSATTTTTSRVVPHYVPVVTPKPKPPPEQPSAEKPSPSRTSPQNTRL